MTILVFKNTKVQSKALIGFSAALSGNPAKTSSIPESPISVETPLVNIPTAGGSTMLYVVFFFF